MRSNNRVLVVGTTPDYIDWIRRSYPGTAVFITDPSLRISAGEPDPLPEEEILCDLTDYDLVRKTLYKHLATENISLSGITSYDCESMELAAYLAEDLSLSYPSPESIGNCRNKYLSKAIWHKHSIRCPRVKLLFSERDAIGFLSEAGGSCVLKPICGSGSELIFICRNEDDCIKGFREIVGGLSKRRLNRLYSSLSGETPVVLGEEFIEGPEFSCDFIVENGRVNVIRLSRKIMAENGYFGITRGYVLQSFLPPPFKDDDFERSLLNGAHALGISRAICMLDFLINGKDIVFLEMTPRPGGDCLPFLILRGLNMDILKINLDFARCDRVEFCKKEVKPYTALRLHASEAGTLTKIDPGRVIGDPRVMEIHISKKPGDVVMLPPEDYDSWILGHIIALPENSYDSEQLCKDLLEKIVVQFE